MACILRRTVLLVSRDGVRPCKRRRLLSKEASRLDEVPSIDASTLTSQRFLRDVVNVDEPIPVHVKLSAASVDGKTLFEVLRERGDSLIEVECGRYNQSTSSVVSMRLSQYIDWLESAPTATVGQQQLYLAQQRLFEVVPSLKALLPTPPFLADVMASGAADLYQTACFLGARGATTPLHRDPYENLFSLAIASSPRAYKDLILVPPQGVGDRRGGGIQANTPDIRDEDIKALQGARRAIVRPGEAVFVPRGWYHTVENVEEGDGPSWSLGVGYWFLMRGAPWTTPRR